MPRPDPVSNVRHGILNRRSTLPTMFSLWACPDILRALEILDRLGIAEQVRTRAEARSGGWQQRLAITQGSSTGPMMILADVIRVCRAGSTAMFRAVWVEGSRVDGSRRRPSCAAIPNPALSDKGATTRPHFRPLPANLATLARELQRIR